MRSTAGKWLEIRAFWPLAISGSVDKFPQSERVKMRKSVAVTLVSLSRQKMEIETIGLLSNRAVTVVSLSEG